MVTPASRPRWLPAAFVLFAVGVLAIAAVFTLFATGHHDLPLWLNLLCLLAPIGLGAAVLGVVRHGRRG